MIKLKSLLTDGLKRFKVYVSGQSQPLILLGKNTKEVKNFTCEFLFLCGGYYNCKEGYTPNFEGKDTFTGQIVHPQKWPEDLNYKNKNIVVIGSGATAVTIIPSMADEAKHITMLQRSPTYFVAWPDEDKFGKVLHMLLGSKIAYFMLRLKNIYFQWWFFQKCRKVPKRVKEF